MAYTGERDGWKEKAVKHTEKHWYQAEKVELEQESSKVEA